MDIEPFTAGDKPALIELWQRCGLTRPWNDPEKDIDRKLAVQANMFLVGKIGQRLVGSVMAGYDGHRGWINYLAVCPSVRRMGYGRKLMKHAEALLYSTGCPKINLQIRNGNETAVEIYRRLGYDLDDVVSMGKRLRADLQGPSLETTPGSTINTGTEMITHAITRKPGPDFADGVTSAGLGTPDYDLILRQHDDYVAALKQLGLTVLELEPLAGHPDAYFVEDPAIVTPVVAVITIPGASSRQGEQESLAPILEDYRQIERIRSPGTVDGGDVLMVGNHFFIGISARTNAEGARQLGEILRRHGHSWSTVAVENGLHLKSDVNHVGEDALLLTPAFEHRDEFDGFEKIILSEREAYAANSMLINERLFVPRGFPDTLGKLERSGFTVTELDTSEVQKMDGGLTCMSLRFAA